MSNRPAPPPLASQDLPEILSRQETDGTSVLEIRGRLDVDTCAPVWERACALADEATGSAMAIDASGLTACDGVGIGLLVELQSRAHERGMKVRLSGLAPTYQRLLDAVDIDSLKRAPADIHSRESSVVELGRAFDGLLHDIVTLVAFIGELAAALGEAALNPRRVRWRDALLTAEQVGVNAMPIIALIGFLLGLILSFQSAIPMKQFGAEIFVADLLGLSLVRELGPLMTAIILAGRSGSAFAAELGTMKVNEELDALATMGLEPVRFLVVTRVIATVAMTPLLTVFSIIFGLLGGLVVFLSLGFPVVTYFNELAGAVSHGDLLGGLFKALVFGLLVAGIGCQRGLQTRTGASAVGLSTTKAVVSGILLIAIGDGLFAVLFYVLDI